MARNTLLAVSGSLTPSITKGNSLRGFTDAISSSGVSPTVELEPLSSLGRTTADDLSGFRYDFLRSLEWPAFVH